MTVLEQIDNEIQMNGYYYAIVQPRTEETQRNQLRVWRAGDDTRYWQLIGIKEQIITNQLLQELVQDSKRNR